MATCKNCGKPLILRGGKCIYCQRCPDASNGQGGGQPRQNENGGRPNLQVQPQRIEQHHHVHSYHEIMVFYRMDGQEMALQLNNGLRELGYDCVLMEIDNAFASKDDEYRMIWKVQINQCKDFFFVITADMANALLNPMSDVHFLLRYLLPGKSCEQKFKDNVHFFIERHYLPIIDEKVFEQIQDQLDKDGYNYYVLGLGSTFVYPLKILRFDKRTGQYDVRGLVNRLYSRRTI